MKYRERSGLIDVTVAPLLPRYPKKANTGDSYVGMGSFSKGWIAMRRGASKTMRYRGLKIVGQKTARCEPNWHAIMVGLDCRTTSETLTSLAEVTCVL